VLTTGGAISGTVTAVTGGGGLHGVFVHLYDSSGTRVATGYTASNGTYELTGLTPLTTGYTLCFDAGEASEGTSTTGYASQCYNDNTWVDPGEGALPAGTTPVPVSAGDTSVGNAELTSPVPVPVPTVTGVSPSSGPLAGTTSITIIGSGLTGATKVLFGNVAATSFTVVSSTEITAVSPPQAPELHNIFVTTPNGTSADVSADEFTYT
jgi:hypothetical protein